MPDTLVSGAANANTQYRYSLTKSNSANNMTTQDFLMLVVAQMTNQDMNNTQDNGQFMAQMAQMASMQAMQELTAAFMSSMSMNYMGKYVKAEAVTNNGHVWKEGFVERVSFNGGEAMVLIDDTWFMIKDVYEVGLGGDAVISANADISDININNIDNTFSEFNSDFNNTEDTAVW